MSGLNYGSIAAVTVTSSASCPFCELHKIYRLANSRESNSENGRISANECFDKAASPAHAVNLLAPQIPDFSDADSKNAQLWIQCVDKIGRIHGASDDVILLAATTRLIKTVLK